MLIALALTTLYFCLIDGIWITYFVTPTYREILGTLPEINHLSFAAYALFVYCMLIGGLLIFASPLVRKDHFILDSLLYGALFGLVTYGIYSGTNVFVIPRWNLWIFVTDIMWGSFLCATSLLVYQTIRTL
ncbi:MAG: DUF2177 family protein [Pseudomonadota bacterium]|nr:DUF2177 family protein [Pseudomonadota bacterium]